MSETASSHTSRPSLARHTFFKNAVVFRLPTDFKLSGAELEEALKARPLTALGPLETEHRGFVASTPLGDRIVHTVNNQHLITLGIHTKILPGSVVRAELEKRMKEVAEEQGFPVGRKQKRDLKDKVRTELLAKALVKTTMTRAWIDTANGWVVVEAAGAARAEKLISTVRDCLGTFAATLLDPEQSPPFVMAQWLRTAEAPLRFSLDSDLEMQSPGADRATVRYARHALDGKDIQVHLEQGKIVTRLGLTWADKISFVLTSKLELKKIAFLEMEEGAQEDDGAQSTLEEQFDADMVLMTGELAELLAELSEALGEKADTAE